jgi:DNA-binding MurR/RpiR family transcriptional regulator
MSAFGTPRGTVEQLLKRIAQEYEGLSARLKLIARFVELHGDNLEHMGIRQFSGQCGVHPSAVVRFAQRFGFAGFADMRTLFRDLRYHEIAPDSRSMRTEMEVACGAQLSQLADAALAANIARLQRLRQTLDRRVFAQAVDLVECAETIWIAGAGRAFPVAVYLEQALRHAGKHVGRLGAFESLHVDQARGIRAGDLVVAISFAPHAQETADVVRYSLEQGAGLVAITDGGLNPAARAAEVSLVVQGEDQSLDAMPVAAGLIQGLCTALCHQVVHATDDLPLD